MKSAHALLQCDGGTFHHVLYPRIIWILFIKTFNTGKSLLFVEKAGIAGTVGSFNLLFKVLKKNIRLVNFGKRSIGGINADSSGH